MNTIKIVYHGIEYDGYTFNLDTNDVINKHGRILKPYLLNWGYYRIQLRKDMKTHYILFHRLVYQMNNLDEDITNFEIDHKDSNKSNNDINNLRLATSSQNNQNRTPCGKSKYIGVYWHKQRQKWCARYNDSTRKHIGYYTTEIDAARAYDDTILRLGLNNGFRKLNIDLYPLDFA
jgi:uncharacterized protein YdcH (DUF465 family)